MVEGDGDETFGQDAEDLAKSVRQYVEPRAQASRSLLIPSLLAAFTACIVAVLDSIQRESVSLVFVLVSTFLVAALYVCKYKDNCGEMQRLFKYWRWCMAGIILG